MDKNMGIPLLPRCAICGTQDQLLRCAQCKTSFYCSLTHQHMDWPHHKQECRLLARQKNNNNRMQQLQQAVAAATIDSSNCIRMQQTDLMSTVGMPQQQQMDNRIANITKPTAYCNNENEIFAVNQYTANLNGFAANGSQINHVPESNNHTMPQQLSNAPRQQLHTALLNGQNGQTEKSSSYQLGGGDENFMGNANERRYEDLCRNIINDMNQYGLSVVDDFLGKEKGLDILNEVHKMPAGVFKDGQLVNNTKGDTDLRTIRGDKITWVKGIEPNCTTVGYLINQIDAVVYRANTMNNNGKLGNYNIKERTKAMVACYPGCGSHYVMHVDNPNKDGRVITAIYYLNLNWDTRRYGGVLRIFPTHSNTIADIEPKFDRLIFFWSDKRNPHEVQPAHLTRYAITVWYFDADEREAALNRCKYQKANNTNNVIATTNTNSNDNATTTTTTKSLEQQPSLNANTTNAADIASTSVGSTTVSTEAPKATVASVAPAPAAVNSIILLTQTNANHNQSATTPAQMSTSYSSEICT